MNLFLINRTEQNQSKPESKFFTHKYMLMHFFS